MNFETVTAAEFGQSLTGLGVNILTRDAAVLAKFLVDVFGMQAFRVSPDFAILTHDGGLLQLHGDATFAAHPLHGMLPEAGLRGTGIQIYLFNVDPDAAVARAKAAGSTILEPPSDKPHGLREATVLAPEGQAFTAAVASA